MRNLELSASQGATTPNKCQQKRKHYLFNKVFNSKLTGRTLYSKLLIISLMILSAGYTKTHAITPPTDPVLTVTNVTDTQISLSWTAATAASGIKNYHMEVLNASNDQPLLPSQTLAGNSNGFTLNGFPSFTFRFKLKAEDNDGNFSNEVVVDATTLATPPPTPPTDPVLSVTGTTDTDVAIAWTESTSAVGIKNYHLEVENVATGSTLLTNNSIGANVRSFTLSAFANTTFRFKLKAEDNDGNFSNEVTVDGTTLATPVATPPSDPVLSVSNTTETEITVSWTNSTSDVGIQNYHIEVSDPGSGAVLLTNNSLASTSNSFTLTGQANTTYRFKLKAEDINGNFSNEVIIDGTTLVDNSGTGGGDATGPTNPVTTDDPVCLSEEEKILYLAVNTYRAENGLAPIPLSRKLTRVAQLHAIDHENHPPTAPECNGHSWSANGSWNACCYTSDHANASCIWDKPREITGYDANGYENYAWSSSNLTGVQVLDMWKNSSKHNDLILNLNIWDNSNWQALGVGIYQGTAFLWVGELADGEVLTTSEAITCDGNSGGGDNPDSPPVADNNACVDNLCDNILVDDAGNVGIGTDTPAAKLHIAGNLSMSANSRIVDMMLDRQEGIAYTGWRTRSGLVNGTNNSTHMSLELMTNANPDPDTWSSAMDFVSDRDNGIVNIGVGTTDPQARLDVAGNVKATAFEGDGTLLTDIDAANITGFPAFRVDGNNLIMGVDAGISNTTGISNVFLGQMAGNENTTGGVNVFVGIDAGRRNTTGNYNTFLGASAGAFNTEGQYNVAVGMQAGVNNTTGEGNVYMGLAAGASNETGSNNVFLGISAGRNNVVGSNNVFIGQDAGSDELGSNKLYIDNSDTTTPLIWGDFENNVLALNGDVGIGTSSPLEKLDINGNVNVNGAIKVNGVEVIDANGNINGASSSVSSYWTQNNTEIIYSTGDVRVTGGGIIAKKVVAAVDPTLFAWPDYVFTDDYKLPSLESVENHIKKEGHLPGVPSAVQINKGGIDLGRMDAISMEKIENLMLYTIQQSKQLLQLNDQVKQQNVEMAKLIQRIEELEAEKANKQ